MSREITTENNNPNTLNIDNVSTVEKIKLINSEDKTVALAVEKEIKNIAAVTDAAIFSIKSGGKVYYMGAGTSGRLGILDASEILPTYGEGDLFKGLIAGGAKAVTIPVENAEDNKEFAINDLKAENLNSKDLVIGIAASGRTPYVISGLEYAKSIGAKSASISTSANAIISEYADIAIEAVVGPETITGSTRMKSGTAQKMILNMISSATMISLGKVYKNWMVDVKPTNEKLINRGIGMIEKITGASKEDSTEAFEGAKRNPKTAIVMIMKKVDANTAEKLLKENEGFLAKVI